MASANLLTTPQTNSYGKKKVYVLDVQDFLALGRVSGVTTTGDIVLETFPTDSVIRGANIKVTVLVAGTAITDFDIQLKWGATGSESAYGSSIDVDTTLGNVLTTTTTAGSSSTTNTLLASITSTGGNISAVTAGQVKIVADVVALSPD